MSPSFLSDFLEAENVETSEMVHTKII